MLDRRARARRPSDGDRSQIGYIKAHDQRRYRLTLKDQAIADAALAGHAEPYRRLDTGVLETLILKGALGMSDDDISHFNGMVYARDTDEALAMVREGDYEAAFIMRPTPVRAGPGGCRRGREHAAQVDLLLPQAADGAAVQPARAERFAAQTYRSVGVSI